MYTPKFKEGEWIKRKKDGRVAQVVMLLNTCYSLRLADDYGWWLDYDSQDNWEITSNPNEESGSSEIPNDLEEAAEEYGKIHTDEVIVSDGYHNDHIKEVYDVTPGESFIAGAKWQKEKDKVKNTEIARRAINGYKEEMMQMAVEGNVVNTNYPTQIQLNIFDSSLKDGQKVRIIIVKEDKK